MKKLLAFLAVASVGFALLVSPVAAQTIPSGPFGSINYWGVGGLSQVLNPGLAGQCLETQGVGSAPVWVACPGSALNLLPSINTNQFYCNISGQFAPPLGCDVNAILNTVGYDIARPPTVESILYKSNVGPTFNWQALPPGPIGTVLASGGLSNPPFWATPSQASLASICQTVGAVLYFDTPSLLWKCLGPGTSGQLLQTGGASGNPSWLTVTPATVGAVPSTRNVNTTAPLGGGGSLSADLTLTCATCLVNGGALGTPSSATLTNATGLPTTGLTGTLQAAQFPALTGDVTTSAGALATTIAANAVTNAKLAQMSADTKKCNSTTSTANPTDCRLEYLHTKDYGAIGNGSTDDTTALQNWLNDVNTTRICGWIDPGTYKTSAALTASQSTGNNICIKGSGFYNSTIVPSNTSQDGIDITTTLANGGGPVLQDFGIQPSGTQVGGNLISLTGPASGGGMLSTHLENLLLSNGWNGLSITNATATTTQTIYVSGCLNVCAVLNNSGFVANGDFGFHNSTFIPATGSVAGILISAGSGLRIYGGKILGAGASPPGILFSPSTAGAYSDIMIEGMSIENTGTCIKIAKGSATTLVNVNIVANECSNATASAVILDLSDASAQWASGVTIASNIIDMLSNNMTGLSLGQGFKDIVVSSNVFRSTTGATGLTGVTTSATAGNATIACDNIMSVASPFSILSSSVIGCASLNGHTNYFGVAPANPVLATCGTTGSATTAAGSTDQSGTITTGATAGTSCVVVFAHSYATAPRCIATNSGGGTAVAAVTTTQTSMTISYGSSASQTYNWQCLGN